MNSEVTLLMIFTFFSLCFYFSTVVQTVYIIMICVPMHTPTHVPQLSGIKSKKTLHKSLLLSIILY